MKFHFSLFSILFVLLLSGLIYSAGYSFGTKQGESTFSVIPGGTAQAAIYFFVDSEYGDRITHINVRTENPLPDGWTIEYLPPSHTQEYNVSGVMREVDENLYVEPRPLLEAPPEVPEDGFHYLKSPSGKGYLQAHKMEINIKAPADAPIGTQQRVDVVAEAFWLGGTGTVALKQTRSFHYIVTVAPETYTEQVVVPETAPEQTQEVQTTTQQTQDNTMLYVVAAIAIIAILVSIYLFAAKNKQPSKVISEPKPRITSKQRVKPKKKRR